MNTRKNPYTLSVFVTVILFLNSPPQYCAQRQDSISTILNGHHFIPVSLIHSPFITTHLETVFGVGQSQDLDFTLLEANDNLKLSLEGDISFIDLHFRFQHKVRDWIAIYLKYGLAVRVGTELQSIIFQGINTIESFEIGWNIKLHEGEKYAVSCNMNLQKLEGSFTNFVSFINDLLDSVPHHSLTESIPVLIGEAGLRHAYGINKTIGIMADADISWGETYIRNKMAFRYALGVSVDINFFPRFSIPFGFVSGYQISSQPDLVYVDNKFAQVLLFKIAWTGSRDFSLGLEATYMSLPLPELNKKPGAVVYGLSTKYYF